MDNNRTWLGSIANAIRALMGMIVQLVGVVEEGLSMAEKAVIVAREKQAVDLTISLVNYGENAVKLASMEQTQVQEKLEEYIKQDPTGDRKKNVATNYNSLKTAVDAELAAIRANRTRA